MDRGGAGEAGGGARAGERDGLLEAEGSGVGAEGWVGGGAEEDGGVVCGAWGDLVGGCGGDVGAGSVSLCHYHVTGGGVPQFSLVKIWGQLSRIDQPVLLGYTSSEAV